MPSIDKKLDVLLPIEGSPPSMLNPPSGCPFNPRCPYRFEPCTTRVPPLEAIPNGHRDACFLGADQKRDVWQKKVAVEIGASI
jgi:peptide/nickel transport system ATP-binding protein